MEPLNASYLLRQDKKFHSKESAVYLYLIASQNFLRTSNKIVNELEDAGLNRIKEEVDEKFSKNKTARDILEHFEEYAIGIGRLQRRENIELNDSYISVDHDEQKQWIINVFNFGSFNKSILDWNIDGLMHFIERNIFEELNPGVEWKGWYPDQY